MSEDAVTDAVTLPRPTVVSKFSLSLPPSFFLSVMILIVRAEYLVLVVFTSEIGVDNVKGFCVRYRI